MLDGTLAPPTVPARPRPGPVPADRTLPRVLGFRPLLAISSLLAALSLIAFRTPTFDVWAWLLWGREAAHLDLSTTWGPAFKPLPVAVATLLSPLGSGSRPRGCSSPGSAGCSPSGPPPGWPTGRPAGAPGAPPSGVAAVGLLLVRQYVGYLLPHGMSEPMMVAFRTLGPRPGRGRPTGDRVLARGRGAGCSDPRSGRSCWSTRSCCPAPRTPPGAVRRWRAGIVAGARAACRSPGTCRTTSARVSRSGPGEGVPVPGGPLTQASPALAVLRQTGRTCPASCSVGAVLGCIVAVVLRSRRGCSPTSASGPGGSSWSR